MAPAVSVTCLLASFAAVTLLLCPVGTEGYTPLYYYQDDYCNTNHTVIFTKDALVGWDHYNSHFKLSNCQVKYGSQDARWDRVQVRFRYLDIRLTPNPNCSLTGLVIKDGRLNLTPPGGVCGTRRPSDLYRTRTASAVTILLVNNYGTIYGDFELLLTAFYLPQNHSGCDSRDFRCNNGICISSSLTCNSYDDCGDNSDEVEGCSLAAGVIAGIVVSAILFVAIFSAIGVCVRRRRMTYVRVTEKVREYPTVRQVPAGSYVPSYAVGANYQTM